MNPENFIADLEQLVRLKPGEQITAETRFREASWWDSMVALNLLVLFEEHSGRQLSARELQQCETIADIQRLAALS